MRQIKSRSHWPVRVGQYIYSKATDQAYFVVEKRERCERDGSHTFKYYLDDSFHSGYTAQELNKLFYTI